MAKPKRIFEGNHKNGLQDIFDFIAQVYVKLAWHNSSASYYGKAAASRESDVAPSEFLLDVVNDAKTLRNKVEDFLSVPRNTFESEQPTLRRLKNIGDHAERDFAALVAKPLDIKQLIIHARRGRFSYS